MSAEPILTVRAGVDALAILRDEGLQRDRVEVMPGASGGPKWLILRGIDQMLWGQFFHGRQKPLHLIGSSAGSWRFACPAQTDPLAAIERLEHAYIEQRYAKKPPPTAVTAEATSILDHVLDPSGVSDILAHPWIRTHIVTTHCSGLMARDPMWSQMLGFGLRALGNVISRKALCWGLQRVVFHSAGEGSPFSALSDLPTQHVALTEENLRPALLASGSIPLVLAGVRDIAGGALGTYRDGGIIDYHFDIDFPPQVVWCCIRISTLTWCRGGSISRFAGGGRWGATCARWF
ncbi:patatin-like phospholipase family protein [Alkalilimnicola ehrlichii]|uniref:patatin-like phospholipase family protein n=1 Tax=Alkalilimnicola ehrlichii TaxID=351052 RepID=UPI001C6EDBF2|nr:patatin-like phospholipase family protein [Alkalilimnicola ehrlichii]